MKLAIILVNWNGAKDTLECLTSLEKLEYPKGQYEVVVVDNASTDNSVKEIKKRFSSINLITNAANEGFSLANNKGIIWALNQKAEYVWILNNDTVVHKNAAKELIDLCNTKNAGVVGSKIYFFPNKEFHHGRYKPAERGKVIWFAGGIIDWKNMYGKHRGVDEVDKGHFDVAQETEYITGCSMLLTRKCVEEAGMFDERYFAYYEDMELSVRAKIKGFSLWYCPGSIVWHKNASSTSRPGNNTQRYYMTRNRLLFGLKYAPPRTKFALAREAMSFAIMGKAVEKKAVIDAALHRFGKQKYE